MRNWIITIVAVAVAGLWGLQVQSWYDTWLVDRACSIYLAPPEYHRVVREGRGS